MTKPRGTLGNRRGQSLWRTGLEKGKDPACKKDHEDGTLWGEKQTIQYTVEQVWRVSPEAVSWPQEAFKMGR